MPNSRLQLVLQQTSLHALLILVSRMLGMSGFGDAQIMDRRTPGQRSRDGGHELLCRGTYGGLPMKVAVKVICDAVRVRMLDEMAGTVLRTRADLGIVVSPFHVTRAALAQKDLYHAARVSIIDGESLAGRLQALGIGCYPNGAVDLGFFLELQAVANRARQFLDQEGA